MLLKKKTRTWAITLVLLFSLLSLNFNHNAQAEDPSDPSIPDLINLFRSLINFNDVLSPHPFRYVGIWESNRTMNIEGNMEFELYFSTPIFAQFQLLEFIDYQDTLKIDVYHIKSNGVKNLIENGNTTIKLVPDTAEDLVQKFTVKLENVQLKDGVINENELLAFVFEIEQTKKPVESFVERRFDTKFIVRLEKIANILRKTDDPSFQEIASIIDIALENLTDLNIGGKEFGALVNVLFSSAFYYGSVDYPSSVTFFDDESEEITLYFQSKYSDFQYESYTEMFPFEKIANETKPTTSTEYAWPPILTGIDELESSENLSLENISLESEIVNWFAIWALYTLGEPIEEIDTNKVTYYLAENNILTTIKPGETEETIRQELTKEPLIWTASSFERNKILTNVTAYLYIHYSKILTFGKVKINATLKKNDIIIATDEKDLDRTNILELIQKGPEVSTKFTFDTYNKKEEIRYNDNLSLEVSFIKKPILGLLRPIKINYGSEQYPSKIIFTLKETDNIKIGDLPEKIVYAGGSAHYIVNISSKYEDTIKISAEEKGKIGNWNIDVYPKEFEIREDSARTIDIFVNSTANDASAYENGDEIDFFVNVSGKTGLDKNISHVSVSEDAVIYGIDVSAPEELEVKHGQKKTFSLTIKNNNTGFMIDRYIINVTSEKGLNLVYTPYTEEYIDTYDKNSKENDESIVNITVAVPWYTEIESGILTIKITSEKSVNHNADYSTEFEISLKVITSNIFESIYKVFESAASKIGLSGKYAGWILISLIAILLIIILIIIIFLKKRGYVEIICLERIKEITPDDTAKYEITIKNPYKYDLTYNIQSKLVNDTQGFDISVDRTELALQSGEEKVINLLVKPNDNVKKDDWCEVKIIIRPCNKTKISEISTITTIKNGKTDVRLSGVFHWPKMFKKDDRVETSFKVWNHGNVSTGKINIILFVNGKEKNKVEDVIIPRGGYADIEIPWIADSGKNEVYIVVD